MFKTKIITVFLIAVGVLALGTARAYAASSASGDALTYAYYNVRGASNYMVVSDVSSKCTMPVPTEKQAFTYTPVETPVVSCDPAKAKPIGVGTIANGGNSLDLAVDIGPFEEPVDVSFGIFAASFNAADIYFLNVSNELTSLQDQLAQEPQAAAVNGQGPQSGPQNGKKTFKRLVPWKSNVLGVDETLSTDIKDLPPGLYVVVLNVTRVSPAEDNFDRFYRWVTYFIVPDPAQ